MMEARGRHQPEQSEEDTPPT